MSEFQELGLTVARRRPEAVRTSLARGSRSKNLEVKSYLEAAGTEGC